MFRALKARGGILSLSRLPLRVHSEMRQNPMSIQRVRFRRRLFRPRAILSGALTVAIFYGLFTQIVLSPLDKVAEELEKSMDEETRKELEVQNESFFIPFPGTTKLIQPGPYRYSDPEWQEYIKFSKNPVLRKRIQEELATFIKSVCERTPVIAMRCGKDIKLRRYWLDFDFPLRPPPEFERSGIEIGDDYITWTTMPVDSLTVFRIRQALWPSAITQSLWSFSKVLLTQDTAKIAGMLGIQTKPQPSLEVLIANHAKRRAELGKSEPLSKDAPPSQASRTLAESKHTDENNALATTTSSNPSNSLAKTSEETEAQTTDTNANQQPLKLRLLNAYMAFRAKFAQTWRPAPNYPPRGSIFVSGLIELDSPNAWLVMDVRAAWDPKTRTYDVRSMHLALRRLQMKKQAAPGGR